MLVHQVPVATDNEALRLSVVRGSVHQGVDWMKAKLEAYLDILNDEESELVSLVVAMQDEEDVLLSS